MKSLKVFLRQVTPPIFIQIIKKVLGIKAQEKVRLTPNLKRIGSFGQQAEDLIIDQILQNKSKGFYVDIGAFDPEQLSNTKRFYLKGWHGINIEPQPNRYTKFVNDRSSDINLNCGVHRVKEKLTFYQLGSETLSTFDKVQAEANARRYKCNIEKEFEVQVFPLTHILEENLTSNQKIDFMSIDTEGNELNVLNGSDWIKYRPTLVLIEFGDCSLEIDNFFKNINYELVFMNNTNGLYLNLDN